ncbi:MAG: hypothetical protein ABSC31_07775 [Acidimicrobiales bacterium]
MAVVSYRLGDQDGVSRKPPIGPGPFAISGSTLRRSPVAAMRIGWYRAWRSTPWSPTSLSARARRSFSSSNRLERSRRALERTLTDGEVAELRSQCIAAVERQFQATLRG